MLGRSGATHDIDVSLVRRSPSSGAGAVRSSSVGTILECKNFGRSLTIGVGRELIGLAADLGRLRLPNRRRLILVSAHGISTGTSDLIEGFGHLALPAAAPPNFAHHAAWMSTRLRF